MSIPSTKTFLTVIAGIAWLLAVTSGLRVLLAYEASPSPAGAPSHTWPADSSLIRAKDRATLIMLAHPRCPCTRASISELALLMASVQGSVKAVVLFMQPGGTEKGWEKTGLWESAAAIPGVTVLRDEDGSEARRFEIETSGHALLFDATGRLVFSGGITSARGHEGDNAGRSAIVSMLTGSTPPLDRTLVFGCALFDQKPQKNSAPWLN